MSAKVYSGIQGIDAPEIDFNDFNAYEKQCEQYIETLRKKCIASNTGDLVGEVIRFGVADGYAEYMVYSQRPLELIHINIMDGYQFEYANLLNVTKVLSLIHI